MNNNHPPFRVGQRVVLLVNAEPLAKKGEEFTIISLEKKCHTWIADIGLICPVTAIWRCMYCKTTLHLIKGLPMPVETIVLAPIDPLYEDITKELAEKGTTEETPDVVRVRELN